MQQGSGNPGPGQAPGVPRDGGQVAECARDVASWINGERQDGVVGDWMWTVSAVSEVLDVRGQVLDLLTAAAITGEAAADAEGAVVEEVDRLLGIQQAEAYRLLHAAAAGSPVAAPGAAPRPGAGPGAAAGIPAPGRGRARQPPRRGTPGPGSPSPGRASGGAT